MIKNPKQWEIWWASFVFEDKPNEVKQRPVLVLDNGAVFPILIAKITTHEVRPGYDGEYEIQDWRGAGLLKKSTVRLSKRLLLEESDFDHKIGALSQIDIIEIQKIILQMEP